MFYDLEDKKPQNSGENWIAPNAVVIGDVTLEKNTSIWFTIFISVGILVYPNLADYSA